MTIENKTADTVLKKPARIKIGSKTISCKPITLATFIAISEVIATFPQFTENIEKTDKEILSFVLTEARNYSGVSQMIAILALGQPKNETFISKWKRRRLERYVANEVPVYELGTIINQLLDSMAIAHFFQCTASLNEINLLRVKRKSIQYGGK